ncbi:MAG: hypothetical protein LBF59_04950, partial [Prevotellaceae bacterium]|nr:hypothetical protein [Prevotellaceae bacterium]
MKKTYNNNNNNNKNNQQKRNTVPVKKTVDTRSRIFPFALLSAVYILIHLTISFNPAVERGWGLNFIRFFEPAVICLFYAIMIAVCLPPVNKTI